MENRSKTNLLKWIQVNWRLVLFAGGILYILFVAGLSIYQQSITPTLIGNSPENKEKEVRIGTPLIFEFNKNISAKDFELTATPSLQNIVKTSKNNVLTIEHTDLDEKTIYYVNLSYKGTIIYQGAFATEGTSIISLLGFKTQHETENFDISISEEIVIVYVRKEPYEENKILAENFLKSNYPQQYDNFKITWIAPLPEDELSWEEMTKEAPDGAP